MVRTLLSAVLVLLAQAPSQQSNAPVLATASIEGIVVQQGTTNSIAGADVELSRVEGTPKAPMDPAVSNAFAQVIQGGGPSGPVPPPQLAPEVRYAKTGADGKFVFKDLKEGKYRLVSIKIGGTYNPAEYGQHDPRQRGLNFLLPEGQAMTGVRLEMVATGAISGRIVDADGEPMGHVSIMALEPQIQQVQRVFNIMQASYTDEHGDYRLFWLPPGRYYVAAKVEDLQKRSIPADEIPPGRRGPYTRAETPVVIRHTLPTGEVVEDAYALVYNGGPIDPDQARPVDVRPGATSFGIDIPMAAGRVRSHHIRGLVIDSTGQPAKAASVTAIPRQFSADVLFLRGSSDANGAFDLAGAVPGSYSIFASTVEAPLVPASTGAAPPVNQTPVPALGYLPVDMGNSDVENVRIPTTRGFTLSGRVSVEGNAAGNAPDMRNVRIVLTRDPDIVGAPAGLMALPPLPPGTPATSRLANGQPDGTGVFSLLVAPGDYRVTVNGLPNTYVKSIRIAGADVLSNGFRLATATQNPLEIVMGADGGEVSATLTNDRMELVTNAVIALVPDSPINRRRAGAYRSGTTDGNGKFRITAVPPGTYKVFGWEYTAPGSWQDPEFLRPYESAGKTITVTENGKVDVPLTVLPLRQ